MRFPTQIALWRSRGTGAPAVVIGVQVSETGSYRAPSFSRSELRSEDPPQTMTREPVQTIVWPLRGEGCPVVAIGLQVLVAGSKRFPGQITRTDPVHAPWLIVVCVGAPLGFMGVQASAAGSYIAPSTG